MSSGDQPALTTPNGLTLRPVLPADADMVLAAYRDPHIRHWHGQRVESEAQARSLIDDWNSNWPAETGSYWAIVDDDRPLGRVSLSRIDLPAGRGECGYWVLPAARGNGIAGDAVVRACQWAFDLGLHRLELVHAVANTASCRVADKAGFTLEGTMRSALLHVDGWHDMHLHARIQQRQSPYTTR